MLACDFVLSYRELILILKVNLVNSIGGSKEQLGFSRLPFNLASDKATEGFGFASAMFLFPGLGALPPARSKDAPFCSVLKAFET